MNASNLLVKTNDLSKSYWAAGERIRAVNGVNLAIEAGEMVALVGPTGSGKTTLLSLLAGLDEPNSGSITLMGQRLVNLSFDGVTDLRSRAVGFIYQTYNLFPGFTVRDNIGLPLRLMLNPPFDAHQRAQQVMDELNLAELADRYPPELSGGQQQLVAIARALAVKPPLILADEPTANLDTAAARQIMGRLRTLTDRGDHGVLLTTHDLRMASQADRVLNLRDGRIVKETSLQPSRTTNEVMAELA